jgi:hypothetical protein
LAIERFFSVLLSANKQLKNKNNITCNGNSYFYAVFIFIIRIVKDKIKQGTKEYFLSIVFLLGITRQHNELHFTITPEMSFL